MEFVTIELFNIVRSLENNGKKEPEILIEIFGVYGIPLFNWFDETKIIEDQIMVGNENYVVVANKVAENTYITTKVKFTIDDSNNYKLNILPLLVAKNNILKQQYSFFIKQKIEKFGIKKTEIKLTEFFEEKDKSAEYDLKEIQYKINVKGH